MKSDNDNIALNLQPVAGEKLTGIGFFTVNVVRALRKEDFCTRLKYELFDFLGRNNASKCVTERIGNGFDDSDINVVKTFPLGAYIRLGKLGKIFSYERITKSKAKLTVFFNYLVPEGLSGRSIITIYDMVCERYPETMQKRNRRLLQARLSDSCKKADAIVTISEFSRKEISELMNVPLEKIHVAPCAIDSSFYRPQTDLDAFEASGRELFENFQIDDYILFVGTLEPRKNVTVLVSAFEKISKDHPKLKLVLAGGRGWQNEETLNAISNSVAKEKIVMTGYISEEVKRELYRHAKAFVFPSLYEGFGMPVLEAMACGTNVVCSDASSLPEVTGDMAQLVKPDDTEGFAAAIEKVLSNNSAVTKSPEELFEYAAKFGWDKACAVYAGLIKSLI